MEGAHPLIIHEYTTPQGGYPFREWVRDIRDAKAQAIIRTRVQRLSSGNLGDSKQLTSKLYELRIHYGTGYRVYFCKMKDVAVILLCGGEKNGQKRDIAKAKKFYEDLMERNIWN